MTVAIDFDGTCVKHAFPKIGEDIGAVPVLKELIDSGHSLILFTMRSDIVNPTGEDNELHLKSGNYLTDAINWFKKNEIPLYGIQSNPTQHTWTTSPKAYAQLYIDDAALGCPLLVDTIIKENEITKVGNPYVNWEAVREYLVLRNIIKEI